MNCKQLVSMIEEDNSSFRQTRFYYAFYDFDGTTGFDIPDRIKKTDKEYLHRYLRPAIRLAGKDGAYAKQRSHV